MTRASIEVCIKGFIVLLIIVFLMTLFRVSGMLGIF
jgi:hypothetical protein